VRAHIELSVPPPPPPSGGIASATQRTHPAHRPLLRALPPSLTPCAGRHGRTYSGAAADPMGHPPSLGAPPVSAIPHLPRHSRWPERAANVYQLCGGGDLGVRY
jgi:hypothetical protein